MIVRLNEQRPLDYADVAFPDGCCSRCDWRAWLDEQLLGLLSNSSLSVTFSESMIINKFSFLMPNTRINS